MSNPQKGDQSRSLRAFVLCGGLGTRLRTVVSDRPKSMALVAGVPFLELLLRMLRAEGIQEVVLGTGHMAEQIERHFGNGQGLDLLIRYSREHKPMGTGGALKLAEEQLSDPVVVLNGDSYAEWKLGSLLKFFDGKEAALVMVLQAVADVSRYGSVAIDSDGRVIEFVEKGRRAGAGLINAGVYLLRKEIIAGLPAGKAVSLEKDVFPELLSGKVYGFVSGGLFIDIGIPADLERAQTLLALQARAANGGNAVANPAR
jgi:NDP-sugar pyrophosphorylase family protein